MKINAIRNFIESKKKIQGIKITEYFHQPDINFIKSALNIKVGPDSGPIMISKDETYLELGPPSKESISFVLQYPNAKDIYNGRITLIGSEVNELKGQSISFAQIIIIAGKTDEKLHKRVERAQYIGKYIEGYMIRSLSHRIWSRISFDIMKKQFSFEKLGMALMLIYLTSFTHIEAIEIIFVTSSDKDVKELKPFLVESQKISAKKFNKLKKRYECDYEWDCIECPNSDICDEIKDMIEISENLKKKN